MKRYVIRHKHNGKYYSYRVDWTHKIRGKNGPKYNVQKIWVRNPEDAWILSIDDCWNEDEKIVLFDSHEKRAAQLDGELISYPVLLDR
jgi:hypothetical protein